MLTSAKTAVVLCLMAGAFVAGHMMNRRQAPANSSSHSRQIPYYTCPMLCTIVLNGVVEDRLARVAAECRATGRNVHASAFDVTNPDAVADAESFAAAGAFLRASRDGTP